jgi:hypothetical protein
MKLRKDLERLLSETRELLNDGAVRRRIGLVGNDKAIDVWKDVPAIKVVDTDKNGRRRKTNNNIRWPVTGPRRDGIHPQISDRRLVPPEFRKGASNRV